MCWQHRQKHIVRARENDGRRAYDSKMKILALLPNAGKAGVFNISECIRSDWAHWKSVRARALSLYPLNACDECVRLYVCASAIGNDYNYTETICCVSNMALWWIRPFHPIERKKKLRVCFCLVFHVLADGWCMRYRKFPTTTIILFFAKNEPWMNDK